MSDTCRCYSCLSLVERMSTFVVCPLCGNKRCPRATHHDHTCTGSNELGQTGSRFADWKPPVPAAPVESRRRMPWVVLQKRDTDPWEVWPFDSKNAARQYFDQVGVQWSETYLLQIVLGPDPLGRNPTAAELPPAEPPVLSAAMVEELQRLRAAAGERDAYREALSALVAMLPRCPGDPLTNYEPECNRMAVWQSRGGAGYCDEHSKAFRDCDGAPVPHAEALRRALAVLGRAS